MTEHNADPGAPPPSVPAIRLVVDRIVDAHWAVLEPDPTNDGPGESGVGGRVTVPLSWLPKGVREGDAVRVRGVQADAAGVWAGEGPAAQTEAAGTWRSVILQIDLDPAARAERAAQMEALRARIPRGPSGDFAL
jgi:hypothetical protein